MLQSTGWWQSDVRHTLELSVGLSPCQPCHGQCNQYQVRSFTVCQAEALAWDFLLLTLIQYFEVWKKETSNVFVFGQIKFVKRPSVFDKHICLIKLNLSQSIVANLHFGEKSLPSQNQPSVTNKSNQQEQSPMRNYQAIALFLQCPADLDFCSWVRVCFHKALVNK